MAKKIIIIDCDGACDCCANRLEDIAADMRFGNIEQCKTGLEDLAAHNAAVREDERYRVRHVLGLPHGLRDAHLDMIAPYGDLIAERDAIRAAVRAAAIDEFVDAYKVGRPLYMFEDMREIAARLKEGK